VTEANAEKLDFAPVTTIVPEPKRRVFRRLSRKGVLADFAWRWVQRLLFHPSPVSANRWRLFVLRCFGAQVAPTVKIHPRVRIVHPWSLTLDHSVVVLHDVILDCQAPVRIGAWTRISQLSHLCTATHVYEQRHMPIIGRPISVGCRCWLAADVFVGCGVTIGDGAVIGARASVFKDVSPDDIVKGVP
jgi:putative colanic acid biosynthesis acetyltransferase WcaF